MFVALRSAGLTVFRVVDFYYQAMLNIPRKEWMFSKKNVCDDNASGRKA